MHLPSQPPAGLKSSGLLVGAVLFLLSGCATPTAPPPASQPAARPTLDEAIEQARRDERQRIMQEYWQEHTTAPERGLFAGPEPQPPLPYPAGRYDGIRFGPRQAPDSSLAEPER